MDLSVQKILKSPFELEGRVNKIIFLNLDLKKDGHIDISGYMLC